MLVWRVVPSIQLVTRFVKVPVETEKMCHRGMVGREDRFMQKARRITGLSVRIRCVRC